MTVCKINKMTWYVNLSFDELILNIYIYEFQQARALLPNETVEFHETRSVSQNDLRITLALYSWAK